jgi:hypothetical protein
MPRFYFDVRQGPRFSHDNGGKELEGVEDAKCHAAQLAGEMTRDMPLDPADHVVIVEVRNEHKQRILTMTVSLAIEQPGAERQPHNPWGA